MLHLPTDLEICRTISKWTSSIYIDHTKAESVFFRSLISHEITSNDEYRGISNCFDLNISEIRIPTPPPVRVPFECLV